MPEASCKGAVARMPGADSRQFYDALAPYYDLIYENWEASMSRQGEALARVIEAELGESSGGARVLDAACGIGTQALPLALRGFHVTGRDISPGAIDRLRREAGARHLSIDAAVADMQQVAESVAGPFDVVLAFDNSLPHLLTDADILGAFREFGRALRPGGLCLCSVRDYDAVERGVSSIHPYGERRRGEDVFMLRQEWTWETATRYTVTMIVEKVGPRGPEIVVGTRTSYYAVSTRRLLELMTEAGLVDCRRRDDLIYQPVLLGRAA